MASDGQWSRPFTNVTFLVEALHYLPRGFTELPWKRVQMKLQLKQLKVFVSKFDQLGGFIK